MEEVTFKVLKLVCFAKVGSEVVEGAVLVGHTCKGKVYYTDACLQDWIFYVGDTCKIINQ